MLHMTVRWGVSRSGLVVESVTEPRAARRPGELAPRMVLFVTVLVFACFILNVAQHVALEGDPGRLALALLLAGATVALHLGVLGNPSVSGSSTRARLAAAAIAVLSAIGLAMFPPWGAMAAVLVAAAFVVLPWMFAVLSIVAVAGIITALTTQDPLTFWYNLAFQTLFGLGFFVLARLRTAVVELDVTRDALQNAAAQQERLRLAQDLHDLLGLTLSAITLKAELAKRLIAGHPDRARRELDELRDIARRSRGDLAAIPSGAAQPELDEELRSASAVLADAGVTLTITGERGPLSAAAANTFALIVREATANVLRHSSATTVAFRWRREARSLALEIVNDGVPAAALGTNGQGHRNLRARVQAVGGRFEAVPHGPTFRVTTTLPLRAAQAARSVVGARSTLIVVAVFGAEALHAVFLIAARPHPVWMLAVAAGAAVLATGILARELAAPGRPFGWDRVVTFAAIVALVFGPMVLLADPFAGPPGVAAAAALMLLPRRFGLAGFLAIAIAMPIFHLLIGSGPFYAVWSVEVVIDHGLVLFAILQLSRTVRELRATRAQLEAVAIDETRLRFERELDALLRPGLDDIDRRASSALDRADDSARAVSTIDGLITRTRALLAKVRLVAAKHRPEEPAQTAV